MYGEPRRIRQVAQRLETRAQALRERADELHARSEDVEWCSLAADRMRAAARERRDELVAVAGGYEEAAQRVREHADRVQLLLDRIADIERQAHVLISAARGQVRAAVDAVVGGLKDALTPGDEAARRLGELACPPPGHRSWLDMPDLIPGIRL